MKLLVTSLATLFALVFVVQAEPTHQFDHFYAGWNALVQDILRVNCSTVYADYLTGHPNYTLGKESLVNPVIDCVLGVFPESRKAECKYRPKYAFVDQYYKIGLSSRPILTYWLLSEFGN